ncbi:hypothetical protein MS2017_1383 [Bathymodiolus thermophilus thioautotrophic gill symbiont]|uniref:Conjugal transfer protein n=1 Tax=Bathymodiolus thermophilus thioautotrophic gill symbiont TaxID=2360 RepID=A0A3G3IMQ3_9GAMM|nr:hypothetical protein [Bathymodiolus thermophilus thioautotrophic gill symbiont]AYQ57071.1 hypothetical protein MS2017_1383 [Bathymodiolus thermophilus thioautotrophic gill symbiont]
MKTLQKTKQFLNKNQGNIALGLTLMLIGTDASAWATPASGTFFFKAYDMVINDFLKGAPGYIAGGSLLVGGIITGAQGDYRHAIPMGVGGGLLASADTIITSVGITIGLI